MADDKKQEAKPSPKAKGKEEPPPTPPDESPVYQRVKTAFSHCLAEGSHLDRDDLILQTTVGNAHDLLHFLRDDDELCFDYLPSMTAVDYPDREGGRFDVVWTLISTRTGAMVNVVAVASENDDVPSVVDLWVTAGWHEREAYDMFGLRFSGHPDLRRILLPDWWEGFPLRKDYPVEGRGEHELVVEECLRPQM